MKEYRKEKEMRKNYEEIMRQRNGKRQKKDKKHTIKKGIIGNKTR